MSKKLKEVLERAKAWPQEAQEELARMADAIDGGLKSSYHATLEELRAIDDRNSLRQTLPDPCRAMDAGRRDRWTMLQSRSSLRVPMSESM